MDQQLPDGTRHTSITPNGPAPAFEPTMYGPAPTAAQPQPAGQPLYSQQPYGQQPPPQTPYGYQPQPIYVTQQVHVGAGYGGGPKSMVAALLLTFFFGPLGLFYVSVTGALVMIVVSIVVGIMTFGVGLLLTAPACMVWAAIATNNYNARFAATGGYSQISR